MNGLRRAVLEYACDRGISVDQAIGELAGAALSALHPDPPDAVEERLN